MWHNKLKKEHQISTEKILSIQTSWNQTLTELENVTSQLTELTKNFEAEKVAHAKVKVDLEKVKSSKSLTEKLLSQKNNNTKFNKPGLGFTHEPMPESVTNTLPENFNTHDYSSENKAKLKEHKFKRMSEGSSSSHVKDVEVHRKPKPKKQYVVKESEFVMQQLVELPKLIEDKVPDETSSDDYGFKNPKFIKWQAEQKLLKAKSI